MNDIANTDVKVVNIEPDDLLVALPEEEINKRSRRCSELWQQIKRMDAERDASNKLAKSKIQKLRALHDEMQEEVNTKACRQKVGRQEIYNFKTGTVTTIRVDTREELDKRAMTILERQETLPLDSDAEDDDFFTADETPSERLRIRPPLPSNHPDISEEPDTSILDASPEREERDTEVPPPELATEKKKRGGSKKKNGGKQ